MSGRHDAEDRLRRHLAAEADELPFLLDADVVHRRLAEPRARWRLSTLVPAAALVVLAVVVGGALLASTGRAPSGGSPGWGPMAVAPSTGGDQARTTGVLRIGDRCVVLETAAGEMEMLVWPADRSRWDASARSIGFTNFDGSRFTLREGEAVSFGGGGDATAEGGVSGADWAASVDWVSAPDPSCPMEIRWYVGEVVSQGPAAGADVVVESAEFPGVEIACRGEASVEAEACRAWGVGLLADATLPPDGVTLLVLTANAGNARCAADFYVGEDRPVAVTAAVMCPSAAPAATDGSPPPLNDLEAKVVDALSSVGVEGQRAEYSATSAFIWSPLDDESAVFVHAHPTGTDRGEFSVLGERVIVGRSIQRVEYASGPVRERFDCAGVTYEAEGATPPGFASFDDFLADLIGALGCAGADGG